MKGKMTQDELALVSQVATAVADELLNTTEWPENPHDTCLGESSAQRGKKGKYSPIDFCLPMARNCPMYPEILVTSFSLCRRSSRIGSRDTYPRSEGRYCGLPL